MKKAETVKRKACGIILFRERPQKELLLMVRHTGEYDFPKGHIKAGESEIACALRETEEETGIHAAHIQLDPDFQHEIQYIFESKRFGRVHKTVLFFLGQVTADTPVHVSHEHKGCVWWVWQQEQKLQKKTIDEMFTAVSHHWQAHSNKGKLKA